MRKIPAPSKKRLIVLSRLLLQQKKEKITSSEISELTGWGEASIRRDISLLELHNGVSNGYDVEILRNAICDFLKIDSKNEKKHRGCIVGLGKIGEALLESSVFKESDFEIVAGFDTNFNKIEMMKSEIPLYTTLDLEQKIHFYEIEFAILAVPDEKAQFISERLASSGIKGILNYTSTFLSLPPKISVKNMNVISALTELVAEPQ